MDKEGQADMIKKQINTQERNFIKKDISIKDKKSFQSCTGNGTKVLSWQLVTKAACNVN